MSQIQGLTETLTNFMLETYFTKACFSVLACYSGCANICASAWAAKHSFVMTCTHF